MIFRKINENTINCIITVDDMNEKGIDLNDVFERKQEAMDYLKSVIMEAARKVNFSLKGEYTSLRISVLPDHSISLMLYGGDEPVEHIVEKRRKIKEAREAAERYLKDRSIEESELPAFAVEYGFIFSSLSDAISGCAQIGETQGVRSQLYQNRYYNEYFLILTQHLPAEDTRTMTEETMTQETNADPLPGDGKDSVSGSDHEAALLERMALSLNEFGIPLEDWEDIAYIKEHEKCILKEDAIQTLAKMKD